MGCEGRGGQWDVKEGLAYHWSQNDRLSVHISQCGFGIWRIRLLYFIPCFFPFLYFFSMVFCITHWFLFFFSSGKWSHARTTRFFFLFWLLKMIPVSPETPSFLTFTSSFLVTGNYIIFPSLKNILLKLSERSIFFYQNAPSISK